MTTTPPEAPTGPEQPPGDPGPQPGPQQGPRVTSSDIKDLTRLRRTTGPDKKIAGVAGGLARHFDIDPLLVRVLLVVLVFFGGAGIIVYGACWLLVPEDGDAEAPFNFDERTRTVALVVAGVIAALALVGDTMGGYGFPWPLAVIALVVLLVVSFGDRKRDRTAVPPTYSTTPPPPSTQGPDLPQTQQGWVEPGTWQAQPYTTQQIQQPVVRAPRRPRKPGPILFWWTLALAALGLGILGMVDNAGAGVADSAYPALVVAICGVMLLIGAFFGRPGGLILVGLIAAIGMAGATANSRWEDQTIYSPDTAASVDSKYEMGAGELILDLGDVQDIDNLDGREVKLDVGAGRIEVRVPEGVDVSVETHVGLGDAEVLGDTKAGGGINLTAAHDGGTDAPQLDLDIQVGLGEVDVYVVNTNGAER